MDDEPLLPQSLQSHRSTPLPFSEISDDHPPSLHRHTKSTLHRAKTAPSIRNLIPFPFPNNNNNNNSSNNNNNNNNNPVNVIPSPKPPNLISSNSILKQSVALLLIYLSLGVLVYSTNPEGYSGVETHPAVDALYFCIVTLCTIGYGDIAPLTPATKAFACIFVLVGFGLIDVLLSTALGYVLDLQEAILLAAATSRVTAAGPAGYIVDAQKGRMRIRLKVGLAIGVVVLCIGAGALSLHLIEGLDWLDSLYLSVMSVTTVGYGDRAFNTMAGRVFASVWLLVSTLAVARAFLFLAEARIDKRQRRNAKWVLDRDLTIEDLMAADLNHNGFISKSEYVIYKLKEMGKIGEKDILLICNQFNKLDPNNTGKITLPHLLINR